MRSVAAFPNVAPPMENIIIAMLTVQPPSPIDRAVSLNKWVLFGYIATLFLAALMTFLSWLAGSNLQDLVQKDADARIAEADSKAATANESAGKANERAGELESANLTLRDKVATLDKAASDALAEQQRVQTELEEQRGRTATLEKKASDALAAQQRVETALAAQQERAANAERRLESERLERLQLQESLSPRNIVNPSMTADLLKPFSGTRVIIEHTDEDEPRRMANSLASTLEMAGWRIEANRVALVPTANIAVHAPIILNKGRLTTDPAAELIWQLRANKVEVELFPSGLSPNDPITISIGIKVPRYLEQKRTEELNRDFFFGEPIDPLLEPLSEPASFHHFTAEQQRRVIEVLKKPVWTMSYQVQLRCPANDDEACELAAEIGVLLRHAGIQIHRDIVERDKNFPSFAPGRGIKIEKRILVVARWKGGDTAIPQNQAAAVIAGAFEAVGLPVGRFGDRYDPTAPILILVSGKNP